MLQSEIEEWKKRYHFLENIIEDCTHGVFVIKEEEESRNEGLGECRTQGYDCTQGESTYWEWYGVRDGSARKLEGGLLKDAMFKEKFDYMVTHEHITAEKFDDDTIRIYNLRGE